MPDSRQPGGRRNPLRHILSTQGFAILDGALATELERHGADLRDPLWSAKLLYESPELIRQVHLDYLHAGADVISTASYQATIAGFESKGFTRDEAVSLLKLSVELAVAARDAYWEEPTYRAGRGRPLVAASVGPYGAYLADGSEYHGDYGMSEKELMDFHRPRLAILSETDADLLAFETVPSLVEGSAIVQLLSEYPSSQAWLAFSCRDAHCVNHGEPIAHCAALAESSDQIVAVGINCTAPRFIESLVRDVHGATEKPIVVYPNSGESWDVEAGKWIRGLEEVGIASGVYKWHAAGARLIGGCCRTTPDDIVEVRFALIGVH